MKNMILALVSLFPTSIAYAVETSAKLDVTVGGINNGALIDKKFAFCKPDGKGRTIDGGNISPAISWSGAPAQPRSYAVLVIDPDVPEKFDTANKAGEVIAKAFPRQNFYHWVLTDIPANVHGILEGKNSTGVNKQGKPTGATEYGTNGKNDYGFGGYDGPCPPWNDERLHNYHFTVYALDVASLQLPEGSKGPLVEKAMAGHIIAKGEVVGTYANNPAVLAPIAAAEAKAKKTQ